MSQHEWTRVRVGDRTILMSRDAVKDETGRRINPTRPEALEIARQLGGRLPTPEELDARFEQAEIKNPFRSQDLWKARGGKPADRLHDDGALASRLVDQDVAAAGGVGTVGNPGKACWTAMPEEAVRRGAARELYGGHVPRERVSAASWSKSGYAGDGHMVWPSESIATDAWVIQRSKDSSHDDHHRDYATVCILSKDIEDDRETDPAPDTEPEPFDVRTDWAELSVGKRLVVWLGQEWGQPGGVVEIPGPEHNPRILSYSQHCRRGGVFAGLHADLSPRWEPDEHGQRGVSLSLWSDELSWCAATVSGGLMACLRPGEPPPFGPRVSVRELVEDARRAGTFRGTDYEPQPGDLQILARWVYRGGQRVLADPTKGDNGHVRLFVRPINDRRGWFFGGNESTEKSPQGELNHQGRDIRDPLLRGWIACSAPRSLVTGIDVSHWQPAASLNHSAVAEAGHRFLIARACYGVTPDREFPAHVSAARAAGLQVGAYMFFKQHQSVAEHVETLVALMAANGIGAGDIVPAVDLEYNDTGLDGPVEPDLHNTKGRAIVEALSERYGACLVYLPVVHYDTLEHPAWVHEHPVWIAHHGAAEPRWPHPWAIWQNRVAPGFGFSKIDFNVARELPRIA